MSILSDLSLRVQIEAGRLGVEPFDSDAVQPSSIDVTLAKEFLIYSDGTHEIDARSFEGAKMERHAIHAGCFRLWPGQFALGGILERIAIPDDLVGFIVGKSSLARIGLQIEAAGLLDAGYCGNPTLELKNLTQWPIKLWPGQHIGQLYVLRQTTPSDRPYGHPLLRSRYQGHTRPEPARSAP